MPPISATTFKDGMHAEFHADGRWDLTLPSGRHLRGQADSPAAAEAAVAEARRVWILEAWERGRMQGKVYAVPLGDRR